MVTIDEIYDDLPLIAKKIPGVRSLQDTYILGGDKFINKLIIENGLDKERCTIYWQVDEEKFNTLNPNTLGKQSGTLIPQMGKNNSVDDILNYLTQLDGKVFLIYTK